jgi:hypothetical protein
MIQFMLFFMCLSVVIDYKSVYMHVEINGLG